ncbi:hypothetical protein BDAP_001272 [Binucleata daphniae]
MDKKNQELALKNIQLKEELKKLVNKQNEILKQNIKCEYLSYKNSAKMIALLDDNISTVEEALMNMKKLKELLTDKKRCPLTEKINK